MSTVLDLKHEALVTDNNGLNEIFNTTIDRILASNLGFAATINCFDTDYKAEFRRDIDRALDTLPIVGYLEDEPEERQVTQMGMHGSEIQKIQDFSTGPLKDIIRKTSFDASTRLGFMVPAQLGDILALRRYRPGGGAAGHYDPYRYAAMFMMSPFRASLKNKKGDEFEIDGDDGILILRGHGHIRSKKAIWHVLTNDSETEYRYSVILGIA